MIKKKTREDVIVEINRVKKDLKIYRTNPESLPDSFSYPKALKMLQFLRNSLVRRKK